MDENKAASDALQDEAKKLGIMSGSSEDRDTDLTDKKEKESDDEAKEPEESEPDEDSEPEEDEEESEEDDEPEDEEESEDEDEDTSSQPPKKYVPIKKFKEFKARTRAEKESLLSTISKLEEENEKISKNQKPSEPSPERKKLLEKLKNADPDFNPENLSDVIDTIKAELTSGSTDPEISKKVEAIWEYVEGDKKNRAKENDRRFFTKSWSSFLPEFKKSYPNASSEDVEKAQSLMDKVWHSKQFHSITDIGYVFFKNREKFDAIVTPRKRGLETGRSQGQRQTDRKPLSLPTQPSSRDLKAAERILSAASFQEDQFETLDDRLD